MSNIFNKSVTATVGLMMAFGQIVYAQDASPPKTSQPTIDVASLTPEEVEKKKEWDKRIAEFKELKVKAETGDEQAQNTLAEKLVFFTEEDIKDHDFSKKPTELEAHIEAEERKFTKSLSEKTFSAALEKGNLKAFAVLGIVHMALMDFPKGLENLRKAALGTDGQGKDGIGVASISLVVEPMLNSSGQLVGLLKRLQSVNKELDAIIKESTEGVESLGAGYEAHKTKWVALAKQQGITNEGSFVEEIEMNTKRIQNAFQNLQNQATKMKQSISSE